MRNVSRSDDRGASLVEYALIVMLIALVGVGALAAAGEATSDTFEEAAGAFVTTEADEEEMTPGEKWKKAQEDYKQAIAEAKADKGDDLAAAKDKYNQAKKDNASLPKAEKKTANKAAKGEYNSAKSSANTDYKSAVKAAKNAKAAAKAEWKASK